MKVLLVSFWFPPTNAIGALRVGKFAKYLHEAGHDVRVLSGRTAGDHTLPLEFPEDRVVRTPAWQVDELLDPLVSSVRRAARLAGLRRTSGETEGPQASPTLQNPELLLQSRLKRHYYALVQVPDSRNGWLGSAVRAGREVLKSWRPDVMVASAPPFTTLLVARRLSREFDLPWLAEFRDLWADNPYYGFPEWRRRIDDLVERWTLKRASALTTVTPLWARTLQQKYPHPVLTILNGFAEEDLPPDGLEQPKSGPLTILYTGNIYAGYRDPSPLFEAISLLGPQRNDVVVRFYGPEESDIRPLAERYGVQDRVVVCPRVSYRQSLALQAQSDILLLLQWNHIKDEGNIPAKFFEYIGALRTMLFLGYETGTLAQMIRQRAAGFVSNSPQEIAAQLVRWIGQRSLGIPALDISVRAGLSRAEQFRSYENFLRERFDPAGASLQATLGP